VTAGPWPLRAASWLAFCTAATSFADDTGAGDGAEREEIDEITVESRRVANTAPAGVYATVATRLRFDPLTELQSRGMPEGQADVTVRGGLFENTGFRLGAVTIMDPQTGHYFAGLPVDPAVLAAPEILKGIDNAIAGFNSSIATVDYGLRRLDAGGEFRAGAGSDSLNFQALRITGASQSGSDGVFGASLSAALSEGDGTVANGDHDFERYNLQLQRATDSAQTDLVLAYEDKFYGWPGAYTGFANLAETDATRTTLVFANHRQSYAGGWFEAGAYHRRLVDDYDFDRTTSESGTPGSFDHETRVSAIGLQGSHRIGAIDWRYGVQATADELVSSTDLTNGDFDERDYLTVTIVPALTQALGGGRELTWRAGATLDASDRDSDTVSPLLGVGFETTTTRATTRLGLEFAETTQVPGYTVLKSSPVGLFGGNPDLGRETARQLTASWSRDASNWQGRVAAFYRQDDDLVDWTYLAGAPFARQANAVDVDVTGIEALVSAQWDRLELAAGYTWLDKDADYGAAAVDASYYALNFARHRVTLALRYRLSSDVEFRFDNEYRDQQANPLRSSGDDAYFGALSVAWRPGERGVSALLAVDNLADSDFEPFPGTPAVGRQLSLSAAYRW